jgi:hypothetical protein
MFLDSLISRSDSAYLVVLSFLFLMARHPWRVYLSAIAGLGA